MQDATLEVRIADLGWPVVSPLISAFSAHWSNHCDLITPRGQMISAMPGGVRERPIESLPAKRAVMFSLPCTQAQRAMALAFARHQVGKPYDYGAVLSFGWGAPWHDPAKWFCSELIAAALVAANLITVPAVRRVSPGDLCRLLTAAGARQA